MADGGSLVTHKMIIAGVYAAREHPLGGNLEDLVRDVYLVMEAEKDQEISPSASSTSCLRYGSAAAANLSTNQ